MTRKSLKSKKAISPILATLLLIVIAVAAIVVTYAWLMTYMSSAGQQAGVLLYKANIRFYEENTTKKIDIDIGNRGTSDTEIVQVYIGTSPTALQDQTTTPSLPLGLLADGKPIPMTVDYDWTAGATYHFKIVSTGQTLETFAEQAPS